MSTRIGTTIYTDASAKVTFTQKWTPAGTYLYYVTFAGDRWYKASTSVVVTIIVHESSSGAAVPPKGDTAI